MIITKKDPFTKSEIEQLREAYDVYIKTVIDIEKQVCSAGAQMHVDSEQLLLQTGSVQENIWGGGINIETREVTYNSFINVRPGQQNTSNEIQDPKVRSIFEMWSKFFFKELYTL